jgi:succinate dehydrogenase flavin-adding protein (antitoxin of CptAB toxin-antitoxin module)
MNARIAELHSKVFSTPKNSPEREQAYSELSESDRRAVFNLERDYMLGRITRQDIAEMKQEESAQYKKIMDNDCKGQLRELSQFSMENKELYRQYRNRYVQEREAEQKSRFTENTFKNKPYSFR